MSDLGRVKLWKYFVLAGVVAAGIYVYLQRQELDQELKSMLPHHEAASDSGQEAYPTENAETRPLPVVHAGRFHWQKINRPEGFAVEMPSDIRKIEVPAFSEPGAADQVQMILCNPGAETTFSVSWEDNPPVARASDHSVDHVLDSAKDGALARTQTTEVSESRSNPGGNPGRDFAGRNVGGGVINARLIYAGRRLYLLSASFPSAAARREEDITRFFNSFSLSASSRISESQPTAGSSAESR